MTLDQVVEELNERTTLPEGIELRSICESDGWLAMCSHLQNHRPASHYLRIYRDRKTRLPKITCNKETKKPWEPHAKWAWDTLNQTASTKTSIGFYSQSHRTGQTFWGALDFDLHSVVENREAALLALYREALAAFHRLANQFPAGIVIFEDSGRGFHVLLILEQQIPVSTMRETMKGTSGEGAKVEILPSARLSKWGKPLRAPGTWNPAVDRVSLILGVARPGGVAAGGRFWLAGHEALLPERDFFLSLFFRATNGGQPEKVGQKKPPREPEAIRNPDQIWNDFQDQYFIEHPRTRHDQLTKLVGECSYQYGTDVVLRLAELQFESKLADTAATKEEHLKEADIALIGMVNQWLKKQANPAEALFHNKLSTTPRRDAFRILHNFAKVAEASSDEEFFVSHRTLAERLNISKPGAKQILDCFMKGEAIKQTRPETIKRARRYRWLLR